MLESAAMKTNGEVERMVENDPAESPPGDWFAIWTRSRHEQVVREQLESQQVEVFLPTITRWSRWKDRRKKIAWPLFPSYCFARFDPESALPILRCTGVVKIVSFRWCTVETGTPDSPAPDR